MARSVAALLLLALGCSTADPASPPLMAAGAAGQPMGEGGAGGDGGTSSGGDGDSGELGGDDSPLTGGAGGEAGADSSDSGSAGDGGDAGAAGSTAVPDCDADCEHCYRQGHGDVFVDYAAETGLRIMLRTELEHGQGERLHPPESACILVGYERHQVVVDAGGRPAGSAWDPVGVPEATAFWQLPAIATAGTPWLGTGVATLPAAEILGQSVVLELSPPAFEAGAFSAYATTAFGAPTFLFSTAAGVTDLTLQGSSHAHMNWTFAAAGRVELVFVAKAQSPDSTPLVSKPATFRFLVEPR